MVTFKTWKHAKWNLAFLTIITCLYAFLVSPVRTNCTVWFVFFVIIFSSKVASSHPKGSGHGTWTSLPYFWGFPSFQQTINNFFSEGLWTKDFICHFSFVNYETIDKCHFSCPVKQSVVPLQWFVLVCIGTKHLIEANNTSYIMVVPFTNDRFRNNSISSLSWLASDPLVSFQVCVNST